MEWQDQAEANAVLGIALGVGFLGFLGLLAIAASLAGRGSGDTNPGDSDEMHKAYCFHPGGIYTYDFTEMHGRPGYMVLGGIPFQAKRSEHLAVDKPEIVKQVAKRHCEVSLKGQYMEKASTLE